MSLSAKKKLENMLTFRKVMGKSLVSYFFDSRCCTVQYRLAKFRWLLNSDSCLKTFDCQQLAYRTENAVCHEEREREREREE